MPTEGEEASRGHRRPPGRRPGARWRATGPRCARRPTRGRVVAPAAVRRGRRADPPLDRPGGRRRRLSPTLVVLAPTDARPTLPASTPPSAAVRRLRPVPRRRAGPARAASRRRSAASDYALCRALLPRRRRRPRGDLRLGLGGAQAARRRDGRAPPTGSCPAARSPRPSPRSTPTRRAGSRAGRRSATGCRSSPTAPSPRWPTCTSTSPSRSAASSAASPPPTTAASTTPARARTSAGPAGCGGRCPTASTQFATWREITTVFHEGVPGHHLQVAPDGLPRGAAQPLAAADVLGERARRGLGAVRRAADGRPRLPGRPRRPDRHARRPVASAPPG